MLQHQGRFAPGPRRECAAQKRASSWSVSLFIGFGAGRFTGAA